MRTSPTSGITSSRHTVWPRPHSNPSRSRSAIQCCIVLYGQQERTAEILAEFTAAEPAVEKENKAEFLFLKGRLLNISGEFR